VSSIAFYRAYTNVAFKTQHEPVLGKV